MIVGCAPIRYLGVRRILNVGHLLMPSMGERTEKIQKAH